MLRRNLFGKMKEFRNAKWIGSDIGCGAERPRKTDKYGAPSVCFYRWFNVEQGLKRAVLYVSSLGWNVCGLNGKRVGKDLFTPGWTDYNRRVEYKRYEVKEYLRRGKNLLSCILGDGWYAGNISQLGRCNYGDYPLKVIFSLRLEYPTRVRYICSDEKTVYSESEIVSADLQNGENVDARRRQYPREGKCAFLPAIAFGDERRRLVPAAAEPVRFFKTFVPKLVREGNGRLLFDAGQNITGVVCVRVRGERGAKIVLRHGEILDRNGNLFTANLRTALATDSYILSGEGEEEFFPEFTFHGFRYFEIACTGAVSVLSATAEACSANLKRTGKFRCSSSIVNAVFRNAEWSRIDNFLSVPMDCPQRDERLGWTGDAQIFCASAMYLADCRKFYRKYLTDIDDATSPDGCVPNIAPYLPIVGRGFPAWSDAAVLIPWQMYLMYGDTRVLSDFFPLAERWANYLLENSDGYIRRGFCYGDWLNAGEETDLDVFSTAFFANTMRVMAKICVALRRLDARRYEEVYRCIRRAFRDEFVDGNGRIKSDTQCCYLLAFAFGLLSERQAGKHLLRKLRENGNKLACGFVGVKYLLPVLCAIGQKSLAYELFVREEYPSWGYMVKNGATTIWERWNSCDSQKGICAEEMNSFNHYSLGSCTEWLFSGMLGIGCCEEAPGFEKIRFCPYPDDEGRIDGAAGAYRSVRGMLRVRWRRKTDGTIVYKCSYPKKCAAEFIFDGYDVIGREDAENGRYRRVVVMLRKRQ